MAKIDDYSIGKAKKEIKRNGWIASIFAVAVIFFSIRLINDLVKGNDFDQTTLYAVIAVAAGSLLMFLQRKKMIKELKNRVGKEEPLP